MSMYAEWDCPKCIRKQQQAKNMQRTGRDAVYTTAIGFELSLKRVTHWKNGFVISLNRNSDESGFTHHQACSESNHHASKDLCTDEAPVRNEPAGDGRAKQRTKAADTQHLADADTNCARVGLSG
jgi:hypothetical protein